MEWAWYRLICILFSVTHAQSQYVLDSGFTELISGKITFYWPGTETWNREVYNTVEQWSLSPSYDEVVLMYFLRWLQMWNMFCDITKIFWGTDTFREEWTCGRKVYRVTRQIDRNRKLILSSVLWHSEEQNTTYGTECFNMVCQLSLPCSLAKYGGSW